MKRQELRGTLLLVAMFAIVAPGRAAAVADTRVEAAPPCSIPAGTSASNNTIACNFGLTPEQFKQLTGAMAKGVVEPLIDRVVDISKRLGVTTEAAKTLLRIVGEQPDVPDERLAELLTKIAHDYKRLQDQARAFNPGNPVARDLVKRAETEIETGHLSRARALLREATQAQIAAAREALRLREQARATADTQMLGAAQSTATEGTLALTERNFLQAVDLFEQAAAFVPPGNQVETASYIEAKAWALFSQGSELGDTSALERSITTWQRVLELRPRKVVPLEWAQTRSNSGAAVWRLGMLERSEKRLEEAVAVQREVLEELDHESHPLMWAQVQSSLGAALIFLGGARRLEEAIAAQQAALTKLSRDSQPLGWAQVQLNLGAALMTLGRQEGSTGRLEEAIAVLRQAQEELTPERAPAPWAGAENNIGLALMTLGGLENSNTRIEEAIAAFREALRHLTRERSPANWAATQSFLGNALLGPGGRETGTGRLEEAVAAFRNSLDEGIREQAPPAQLASMHSDLGIALLKTGERESGTARLAESVSALDSAISLLSAMKADREANVFRSYLEQALALLKQRQDGRITPARND